MTDEYLTDAIFDADHTLENGKIISRVYVTEDNVSIYNRESWNTAAVFLNEKMELLERFFLEYQDVIDS